MNCVNVGVVLLGASLELYSSYLLTPVYLEIIVFVLRDGAGRGEFY